MRLALAAVLAVLAAAPVASANPIPEQVPPVCIRQPLPEPVPFGQVQVGYCPA